MTGSAFTLAVVLGIFFWVRAKVRPDKVTGEGGGLSRCCYLPAGGESSPETPATIPKHQADDFNIAAYTALEGCTYLGLSTLKGLPIPPVMNPDPPPAPEPKRHRKKK